MSSFLPSIVLVGRTNVGKSSLFNCLTKARQALVADCPGLTRDRLYGQGLVGEQPYLVIDTGGLGNIGKKKGIDLLVEQQTQQAIREADYVLFLVDGRAGLTSLDRELVQSLRPLNKHLMLVINKGEGLEVDDLYAEFSLLGFDARSMVVVSAAHRQGISTLMDRVLAYFPTDTSSETEALKKEISPAGIKIAIIGKPNAGKSTLLNRLLGKGRVIVSDQPGTTRDTVECNRYYRGKLYTFLDTAGIRRKAKIEGCIENFSVLKSLQAIESCHVVLMVIDALEGVSEQDLHLLGFTLEAGKALVITVNKWDACSLEQRRQMQQDLCRRLQFVSFAKITFISALYGSGIGGLFALIQQAYQSATRILSTSRLTRLLEQAVNLHQPPLCRGRVVKLRYAHPGGYNPPTILIHGQHTRFLPESYRRYLENFYRKVLGRVGSPVRIKFKDK